MKTLFAHRVPFSQAPLKDSSKFGRDKRLCVNEKTYVKQVHRCSYLYLRRRNWQSAVVLSLRKRQSTRIREGGSVLERILTGSHEDEEEVRAQIESGFNASYRQMDRGHPVFAARKVPSPRRAAPPAWKHLPENAYQDSSKSRIHGIDRKTGNRIKIHRCRIFPHQAGQDVRWAFERHLRLGKSSRQGTQRRHSTPQTAEETLLISGRSKRSGLSESTLPSRSLSGFFVPTSHSFAVRNNSHGPRSLDSRFECQRRVARFPPKIERKKW